MSNHTAKLLMLASMAVNILTMVIGILSHDNLMFLYGLILEASCFMIYMALNKSD